MELVGISTLCRASCDAPVFRRHPRASQGQEKGFLFYGSGLGLVGSTAPFGCGRFDSIPIRFEVAVFYLVACRFPDQGGGCFLYTTV